MASDLKEYLAENRGRGFRPVPHYFPLGDFVTYYFRNEPCFARRIDDLLTVYLSMETKELVGCKIKGVRHILTTAGDFGVHVEGEQIRLRFLFFLGAAAASGEQRLIYEQLREAARDVAIDRDAIMATGA